MCAIKLKPSFRKHTFLDYMWTNTLKNSLFLINEYRGEHMTQLVYWRCSMFSNC